ncbi:MAG: hypothetical protein ACOCZQ_00180 [Nanoarchaeota archaeon]
MPSDTAFGGVLSFFERLGVYDVILPFILTFTIFFAILERTQVLGTEDLDGEEVTKKNLNAMIAFVVAFFVVATPQAVGIMHGALPNIVLLVLVTVSFLMLIGTFYGPKEEVKIEGKFRHFLVGLSFVGVLLVFAGAIPHSTHESWLHFAWNYIVLNFQTTAVSSIMMILLFLGIMVWITKDPKPKDKG